jgi:hypothetical protein
MYEIKEPSGRLIIVMPIYFRDTGRRHYVFRVGKYVVAFEDHGEARRFAGVLAKGGTTDPYAATCGTNNDLA